MSWWQQWKPVKKTWKCWWMAETCLEDWDESGKSRNQDGSVSRRDRSGNYWITGGMIRRPVASHGMQEPTEKADVYVEPLKGRSSRKDVRSSRNATMV
jgi:hypothetical protein